MLAPDVFNVKPKRTKRRFRCCYYQHGVVAIGAYSWYQVAFFWKRRQLERFLAHEAKTKRHKDDLGRRTILFLASQLRMTEAEVIEAGFKSGKIRCVPGFNKETHRMEVLYFEYHHHSADRIR